jgi:hypothetical protein
MIGIIFQAAVLPYPPAGSAWPGIQVIMLPAFLGPEKGG